MKTIYTLTAALFFLANINLGFSQDCMPETRIDDVQINKDAAKSFKFYFKDHQVPYGSKFMKTTFVKAVCRLKTAISLIW